MPLIQSDLQAAGVTVELVPTDNETYLAKYNDRTQWDGFIAVGGSEGLSPDRSAQYFPKDGEDRVGLHEPQDLRALGGGSLDGRSRPAQDEIYHELAKILNEDVPQANLYSPNLVMVASKRLGGGFDIHLNERETFMDVETWTLRVAPRRSLRDHQRRPPDPGGRRPLAWGVVGAYFLRRVLIAIPVLIGITIAAFFVLSAAPGDPVLARLDPEVLSRLTPADIEARRRELGLDQPVPDPLRHAGWATSCRATSATRSSAGGSIAAEVAQPSRSIADPDARRGRRSRCSSACRSACCRRSTSTAASTTPCRGSRSS